MKVAQIITRMDWAGAPTVVRMLCERLDPKYEVTLITGPSKHLTKQTKAFLEGFRGRVLIVPNLRRNINPVCDVLALIHLFLICRREKFDIVHTHTSKAGILGRLAAYLAGTRRILHMPHGPTFAGYGGRILSALFVRMERLVARVTIRIIALSKLEKQEYIDYAIAPAGGFDVVPNGLDMGIIDAVPAPRVRSTALKVVGTACRLVPRKGPQYFVKAAAKITQRMKDIHFVVAGEGSLRRELEDSIEENGLTGRIEFTGWKEDVLEFMTTLDVLVLCSVNEGMPLTLLEAQALGVPVVATSVGGVPATVKDGETGILVPPRDSTAIANAVCDLLENAEKRRLFSEEGKRWIRKNFSIKLVMKDMHRIYEEVTAQ